MFALLMMLATPAMAHNTPVVLLLYDTTQSGSETQTLYDAITLASPHVDLSAVDESHWDGTNPSLSGYDLVIHLNGTTSAADMPLAGQQALDAFVYAGGGFIHFEWNAYERSLGGLSQLQELTLFDYGARRSGTLTLSPITAHPVVQNVPSSFSFSAGYNAGNLHSFASSPATVIATDSAGNPAVAVRSYGAGRVVGFSHAGNHGLSANATFADPNVQQLVIDAVYWTARCDEDGDGDRIAYCAGADCDDSDPSVSSTTPELCDGIDNDCDGTTDENSAIDVAFWYLDADGDGYGWPYLVVSGCSAPSGYVADSTDCDDYDAAVHPGAEEHCDGADEDCDQRADNDPVDAPLWYTDADRDGQGDPNSALAACEQPFGTAATDEDCDDSDPSVYAGAPELPYDGVDQDCDGQDLCDVDEDSFDAVICGGDDCQDADPAVSPAAAERWYDGADQDCDGASDYDADADGFDSASYGGEDCDDADAARYPGAPDDPDDGVITDCELASEDDRDGDGYERASSGGEDCDDANSTIHPGAEESWYDGVDQDCDGASDFDADADGFEIPADCDDTNPAISPSAAEIFYDGVDQDCDPSDELDADGDGYDSLAYGGDDCDDARPDTHPGAEESWYDGVDQDCDGASDYDADGDGFARAYDCDDADPEIRPGQGGLDSRCQPVRTGRCEHSPASLFATILALSLISRRRSAMALLLLVPLGAQAHTALSVLILYDVNGAGTAALESAIVAEGASVALAPESSFDGTNPALSGYDVVVHLNAAELPAAGQTALDSFVRGGGGYVEMGFGPSLLAAGQESGLRDLILLDATGTGSGSFTLSASGAHPVLRRVPTSFSAQGVYALATAHSYASDPATVLMTDGTGDDAVVVRELGSGRAVTLHHGGNTDESIWATLTDPNLITLTLDAIYWAFDCDSDGDGALSDYCHGNDCDDSAPLNFLGNPEVCDGVDNDCDGDLDEPSAIDALTWYADSDGDGYGDPFTPSPSCTQPSAMIADSSDCDDADPLTYPGADERCDGLDGDCDVRIDEGAIDAPAWYRDYDSDGYGDPGAPEWSCESPSGYVADSADCDDADPQTRPGADERCGGADEDCDDQIDESSAIDAPFWYSDQDQDGYGAGSPEASCLAPSGRVATDGDCDDADAGSFPGAPERCDDLDTDCDGRSDDPESHDAPLWYADLDGDGHGAGAPESSCEAPLGAVAPNDDCDDDDSTVYPGAAERANDGQDQDCDGQDLCDGDGDGYCGDDCDDADPATHPGAVEVWYDGVDEDCDESSDYDADGDGYESGNYGGDDCDDADPDAHPGAPDAPYDGLVQDCADADEFDVDGDGSEVPEDCDDFNSGVHPGAEERWYDGQDQDCDGNDGDQDGDGYTLDADCDDLDPDAFPGADGYKADCTPRGCASAAGSPSGWLALLLAGACARRSAKVKRAAKNKQPASDKSLAG